MAYDFSGGLPQLDVPDDAVAELVSDESRLRAAMLINAGGWGSARLNGTEFARELERMDRELSTWSSFRVLVSFGGELVATGGCTVIGNAAHLLGSVILPGWRRPRPSLEWLPQPSVDWPRALWDIVKELVDDTTVAPLRT